MEEQKDINKESQGKRFRQACFEIYDKKYRKLLWVSFSVLFIALALIFYNLFTTGEFFSKDVSLKGGVTITVPYKENQIDTKLLQSSLKEKFPKNDVTVRILEDFGRQEGFIVEADIDGSSKHELDSFIAAIEGALSINLKKIDYGIEVIGSSLGESFFKESLKILVVAFVFMGLVVLVYFRTFMPSFAIMLAAFSDMAVALAVVNLLGMKIGTAGIAGFLMLIGYSIDTDILLTVRVLKRKEGTVMDRVMSSIKTGMTETLTAIAAVTVAILVTQSEVIRQIMLILLFGLIADILFTWIQNVGLLRIYLERKDRKMRKMQ